MPAPPLQLPPTRPVDLPKAPIPTPGGPIIDRIPAPRPVLADGQYDSYIRTVDRNRNQLVVDLVQVFDGQAARDAAIADGMARDQAQYLGVYVETTTRGCGPYRWPATCGWTCAAVTARRP